MLLLPPELELTLVLVLLTVLARLLMLLQLDDRHMPVGLSAA
jgi:hypothetical protein